MKTIPEWFKLLPCAARKKAMRNLIKNFGYICKAEAESLTGALGMSFSWSETQEGFDYWYKMSKNAKIN